MTSMLYNATLSTSLLSLGTGTGTGTGIAIAISIISVIIFYKRQTLYGNS